MLLRLAKCVRVHSRHVPLVRKLSSLNDLNARRQFSLQTPM